MKAARFYAPNRPLVVEEVPDPEPGEGELVVRVAACGVCRTDLHYTDHGVPPAKPPPVILGHEISGTVKELGRGTARFRVGDPVVVPAVLPCRECRLCRGGRANICQRMRMYGNHVDGGFAECVVAPARETFRLPEGIPLDAACLIGDALSTAFHAVVCRGGVGRGDLVGVFGCGGVGINVVQMAAARGAVVTAVDTQPAKLDLARTLGASNVILAGPGSDPAAEIRAAAGGLDVAFECIGSPATIRQAHNSIRRGGKLVIVGYCESPVEFAISKVMFLEHDVLGSLGCPPEEIPQVLDLVARGEVRLEPLVSRRFPLEEINEALDALRRGEGVRNIVVMG